MATSSTPPQNSSPAPTLTLGDLTTLASAPPPSKGAALSLSDLNSLASQPPPKDSGVHPLDSTLHAIHDWWQQVNPFSAAQGTAEAIRHPIDTAKAMANQNGELWQKTKDSYDKGDYTAAAAHALNYALNGIPGLGATLDEAGEKFSKGDVAGGVGHTLGIATNILTPELVKKIGAIKITPRLENPNPSVADAVRFGLDRNIPVDAGTATGNAAVKAGQHLADRSIGGALLNGGAPQAAADALTATGRDLAADIHPTAVTPESAGAGIQNAVEAASDASAAKANTAYDKLRQIEANPANTKTVQVGTKTTTSSVVGPNGQPIVTTSPVTKDIAMPVDMRPVKAALAPIEAEISQRMTPAQREIDPALNAIRNILNRDDYLPTSVADKDLSYLKKIQRGDAADPVKRVAGQAIDALDQQVQDAVSAAGPDAVAALSEGRAATIDKYGARDVLDSLRDEPVQAFNQALWKNDAGIDQLRAVQKYAPSEMPKLGRAFVDDLVNQATAEGDFNKQASIWSKWQSLGPETKKLIFSDPKLVSNLDNFFLLAKKMGQNPNPSGTGHVLSMATQGGLLVMEPHIGVPIEIGASALSKMLHNPTAVRALTEGIRVPIGSAGAPLVANKILGMAGQSVPTQPQEQAEAAPIPQAQPLQPPVVAVAPPLPAPAGPIPIPPQTDQGSGNALHVRKLINATGQ